MISFFKTRKLAVAITAGIVTTLVVVAVGLLLTRDSSIAAPERAGSPVADVGRAPTITSTTPAPEPKAPELSPEEEVALGEYLAALEQAQQAGTPDPVPPAAVAPPAPLPPPPSEPAFNPAPVSPDATVPDNQPLPVDPVPEGNLGLPSNPFSSPGASFIAEGDRRPGVRHYVYQLSGGPADWCNTLPNMIANAGYTVGYKYCTDSTVNVDFYGQGRAGSAVITTNSGGQATIELRA